MPSSSLSASSSPGNDDQDNPLMRMFDDHSQRAVPAPIYNLQIIIHLNGTQHMEIA